MTDKAVRAGRFGFWNLVIVVLVFVALAAVAFRLVLNQLRVRAVPSCIQNLCLIDGAKRQWELEKDKRVVEVPKPADLAPYFKGGVMPVCPAGGKYTIGAVGQLPTCNIPGHTLGYYP